MGKIKDAIEHKLKGTTKDIEVIRKALEKQIKDEQEYIDKLNNDIWMYQEQYVETDDPDEKKEYASSIEMLTSEVDRRTKRITDLLRQLEEIKKIKQKVVDETKTISAETVFKSIVYIGGICLVLYAEESRPLISKGMSFLVKPRI